MVTIADIEEMYGCKVVDYSVGGVNMTDNYFMPPAGFFPVRYAGKVGMRQINLTLEFKGTPEECEEYVSDFLADCNEGIDLFLPDGLWYRCIYNQDNASARKGKVYAQHTFRLLGVRHDALVTQTLTATRNIIVRGNRVTPCRLTVSGISGTVAVFGITISGLTGSVVIDGINGKVTQGNVNVFGNTDLTDFPKLKPGTNNIVVPSGCTVKIEYYPLYW